ncbi:uncharacterized protein LOC106071020 isoform X1 [Biomphalaria glabrata]|uniref:Uncharacterized protein LOC106071020 isoform X1 n=1 Tax=Biomphalaria glabrata TaxID=6526 RepID=A0A9W2YH65_BIOGL|nr:uncharacterized protein LOC106071020 isoform X1 [Biomphalaria glabrata]XP_055862186.1 uncharacterized protein LOC106071020 isoform X1 [Biomphalaria glabrata]XP_055862188.1 uncharacterized protein LOC106071020 isoform X1 [Biomphalaria glabrata]
MFVPSLLIELLIVTCILQFTSGRMCTRLVKRQHVQTELVMTQCTQSYKARCGWFSSLMCTYYELVECPVEHNRTIAEYIVVEECCPGFVLDPINNVTCIRENNDQQEEVTTIQSEIERNVSEVTTDCSSLETKISDSDNSKSVGGLHYDLEDNTIFGLSHGAYAGIVCTLLFFMCVIILTAWHIFKRKRNARLKDFKMEMCVTEKMMPPKTSKL